MAREDRVIITETEFSNHDHPIQNTNINGSKSHARADQHGTKAMPTEQGVRILDMGMNKEFT